MLNKIIEFSIKNKLIIGLLTIALMVYGGYQVTQLPMDAVPDITDNQVQIISVAPALGATDIERLVTFPVEKATSNIPGITQLRSFSRFGLSVVTIVFNEETDVYWARQQVSERLLQVKAELPPGIGAPELAPVTTGLGEIYQYILKPLPGYENKYNDTELRTIQDWVVRRQLLGVEGVADVSSFGGHLKQYEVSIDDAKLKALNITLQDVFEALEKNNQNTGGAYIEKGPVNLFIRSEGLVSNKADLESIVVKNLANGSPLLIRDVADIKIGSAIRYGAMTYNGKGEVAGAVVMMLKGGNSNKVIENVKQKINEIQKMLPKGVKIEPFLDRTKMVNNAIGTVEKNLLEGALIVVFVLILFLANIRAGFLVASVIPLSMLVAVILMNLFGVSGNLMSLGALDFGLIVDGAVIIVEAVLHNLSHSKRIYTQSLLSQTQMDKEVKSSASKMMNSAVFGQIIILIVYIPIFTLEGIEGKMFKPMAQTVAFALIGAFILSLTYIPMMSTLLLSKNLEHKTDYADKVMSYLNKHYHRILRKILGHPKITLSITSILFVFSLMLLTNIGGEFIPTLPEGDFAVETRVLTGSSLNTSINATLQAEKILIDKFPEVEKVVAKIGSSEIPTDPMPMDAADLMIILKPKETWQTANTYNELMHKMAKELTAIPGVTFGFQYPVAMRFNELMTGARQDVVCKIFGEDLDSLASIAEKLGKICNTVEGTADVFVEPVTGLPQLVVSYDRVAMAEYGLNIKDVNHFINTAFAGSSAGFLYEGEKRFDVMVRLTDNHRKNVQDIENLLIPTPKGNQIPLSMVANIQEKPGPNQIQRERTQRRVIVGFNVRNKDVQSVVKELQQKVVNEIKLPVGYRIVYGGTFENLEAAKNRLSIAVPIALLIILLMLYFAFGSLKHGLLIYSAIPLSTIGGILALAVRQMPFSISAGVGFIALFGVAVLNGIVLISEFNRLKQSGIHNLGRIIMKGTQLRLRPVLMTAFVASLGFLPMALSNGEGAEVQRPLATVVIGGLLVATFLTLFILPLLYVMFEKEKPLASSSKASILSKTATLILVMVFSSTYAQKPISLKAATDSALKNNIGIRAEVLNTQYKETLIKTGTTISKTNLTYGYGQINSIYNDNSLNLTQNFSFPSVYKQQSRILKTEWLNQQNVLHLKENELKKEVRLTYLHLIYTTKKRNLLLYADSIYQVFLQNTLLKYKNGDANELELSSAKTMHEQITEQLLQIQEDYQSLLLQLQLLINSKSLYQPSEQEFSLNFPLSVDTASLKKHPIIQLNYGNQRILEDKLKLEKAKCLPEFNVTYNNMTAMGYGPDNRYYGINNRFKSYYAGISVPLFFRTNLYQVKADKIALQQNHLQLQQQLKTLQTNYLQTLKIYNKNLHSLYYYQNSALKNAEVIEKTANLKFRNGELSFLEWALSINNVISIKSEYLNTQKNYSESLIELNFLANQ